MPKISIIVPIYNVDKYLKRGIESIQNQSLKDIEIILINDGSKDESLSICKEYAKTDKRIVIIDKLNGGVSSARNAGLKIARGDYIGFVDPDDWIEKDMYNSLYDKVVKYESDVVMCNYVKDDGKKRIPIKISYKRKNLNKKDITEWLIPNMIGPKNINSNAETIMGSVFRLLVKRTLIIDNNILFKEDIPYMEDLVWSIELFLKTKDIVLDEGVYYHYMDNDNSAVKIYRHNLNELNNIVYNNIERALIKEDAYLNAKDRLDNRYIQTQINLIANAIHADNKNNTIEKLKEISEIISNAKFQELIKTIDTDGYTLRKRMILYALKKQKRMLVYIYYNMLNKVLK